MVVRHYYSFCNAGLRLYPFDVPCNAGSYCLSKKSYDFSDRIHPHCPHSLSAKPTIRTVVRIEVFFASAELRQKTDFENPLRGRLGFFDKLNSPLFAGSYSYTIEIPPTGSGVSYLFIDFHQQLIKFFLRDRLRIIEALSRVAAAVVQELSLLPGFNALCDYIQPYILGH